MAQDTLLGFPAHTLPYRCGEFTTLSTVSAGRIRGLFSLSLQNRLNLCKILPYRVDIAVFLAYYRDNNRIWFR